MTLLRVRVPSVTMFFLKGIDVPKKISFDVLFDTYRQNVYPAMLEFLAEDLGVSTDSLTAIGVGYEFAGPSWVFAERDDRGEIVGLVCRFGSGTTYPIMTTGDITIIFFAIV